MKTEQKIYTWAIVSDDGLGLGDCPRVFYKKSEARKWLDDYKGSLSGKVYSIVRSIIYYEANP